MTFEQAEQGSQRSVDLCHFVQGKLSDPIAETLRVYRGGLLHQDAGGASGEFNLWPEGRGSGGGGGRGDEPGR